MVKGRCSYRFQTQGSAWSNWEPVSTADFTAVAAIFATNNAFLDPSAGAFVAGTSNDGLSAAELTLPIIPKRWNKAGKRWNKSKSKNK